MRQAKQEIDQQLKSLSGPQPGSYFPPPRERRGWGYQYVYSFFYIFITFSVYPVPILETTNRNEIPNLIVTLHLAKLTQHSWLYLYRMMIQCLYMKTSYNFFLNKF